MAEVLGIVVFEPEAEASLARWIMDEVVARGLRERVHHRLYVPVQPQSSAESGSFLAAVHTATVGFASARAGETVGARPSAPPAGLVCFTVAVYWDGQTEGSKAAFAELRQLAEPQSPARIALTRAVAEAYTQTPNAGAAPAALEVLLQALNAKRGAHQMATNYTALVLSLEKKLATSQLIAAHGTASLALSTAAAAAAMGGAAAGGSASAAPGDAAGSGLSAAAAGATDAMGATDLSPPAVDAAVEAGQGECLLVLSAPSRERLAERLDELHRSAATVEVAVSAVTAEPREVRRRTSAAAAAAAGGGAIGVAVAQEFLLRRCRPGQHLELRLAVCGNVDSGKSTLTSVLTRGGRDDGRGAARAFVFNHPHEIATGRTSSISESHLGFTGTGEVANYPMAPARAIAGGAVATEAADAVAPAVLRPLTAQEIASRSAKVLTLYDLAGHEKYLKTTVLGMTRNMPDYACIVVSANNGIQRMTKEHLALCLALRLPFFIIVTRIDATPEPVKKEVMSNIHKLLKIPTVRKLPYPVTKPDELILASKNLSKNAICPIFEVSNVTGQGIPEVLQFLNLLPVRADWRAARELPQEMVIDSTFFVTGVGTVVGGIVTQGVFRVNDTVLLGPDGFGHYRPVTIKSIHVKGIDSVSVDAGNDAAFCLKKEKRSAIRKGNIMADLASRPLAYWQFEAEITILYHATTIAADYEPVIHSTTVRQSARMTYVERETLRTGDKSIVRFHFLYRPEFMKVGHRLIFREGRTKGIGVVTRLLTSADEQLLARGKPGKTAVGRAVPPAVGAPPAPARDVRRR